MNQPTHTIRRLVMLAIAMAAVAIGTTPAQAGHEDFGPRLTLQMIGNDSQPVRREDRGDVRGVATASAPHSHPVRPDDRAGVRGVGATEPLVSVSGSANGFDWIDAGLGAASLLGAMLLTLAFALAVRSRRPLVDA